MEDLTQEEFRREILNVVPNKEQLEKWDRAFNARLAYEKNCMAKYDIPGQVSLTPVKGETMKDFACRFGTTIKEMKDCELQVEEYIKENKIEVEYKIDYKNKHKNERLKQHRNFMYQ